MKELHNHIFSNTTCISKEIMMKYINKQLTKYELHEVEKHMLDCDLCTDAMAGMKYAKNSSILFAIDNKIDNKISTGQTNPFFRGGWLMAAASIIAIIFGAYFIVNFLNNPFNQGEIALQVVEETEEFAPAPKENFLKETEKSEITVITESEEQVDFTDEDKEISSRLKNQSDDEPKAENLERSTPPSFFDQPNYKGTPDKYRFEENVDDNVMMDEVADVQEAEQVAPSSISTNTTIETNQQKALSQSIITGNNQGFATSTSDNEMVKNDKKDEPSKEKTNTKDRKKTESKTRSAAPVMVDASKKISPNQNTYYFADYKLVDYAVEYQNEEDFKKSAETNATPVDYLNKEEKAAAEKELDKTIVKETYKEVLERGILNFKELQYKKAVADFEVILAKHPKDVNALFYGGLSEYNLKNYKNALSKFNAVLNNAQTEFNQEAKWYKALTLIELKDTKQAKKILKEISEGNGFYKQQAQDKLKGVN